LHSGLDFGDFNLQKPQASFLKMITCSFPYLF
jgi:hypothetical protein